MKPRCPPILKLPRSRYSRGNNHADEFTTTKKHWTAYIAPSFAVFLLLIPQPSWFILVTTLYFNSTDRLWRKGAMHLAITMILTLLALNSLAICCFKDPGRPRHEDLEDAESTTPYGNGNASEAKRRDTSDSDGSRTLVEEEESLMDEEEDPNDFNSDRRWCRICWAPKPDRTHHCSSCGRCVLRMDHHCPWLSQCVGHRTHPTFLHLLACTTILSSYIAITAGSCIYDLIFAPIAQSIDDPTPLHALFLVVMGTVFFIVIGSFLCFHLYLCFTNQTTLEQLSPFLLLKYLPKSRVERHAAGTSITGDSSQLTVPPSPNSRRGDPESPYYFPSPPATPPAHKTTLAIPTTRQGQTAEGETLFSASKAFSPSPVATNAPAADWPASNLRVGSSRGNNDTGRQSSSSTRRSKYEWDEHSLSFKQRHLVRITSGRMGLWDLGWRRNFSATLGFGYPSPQLLRRRQRSARDDGDEDERERLTGYRRPRVSLSMNTSRANSYNNRNGSDMPFWRWILAVLLYGGPPRGDGRTFPRNRRARGVLEELARGLETLEKQERGETNPVTPTSTTNLETTNRRRDRDRERERDREMGESHYTIGEDVELEDI